MVQNGRISDFHGLLTSTLDPGMVITFFISHRVLPVYQISSKSKKLFVMGQSLEVGLKMCLNGLQWKNKSDLI